MLKYLNPDLLPPYIAFLIPILWISGQIIKSIVTILPFRKDNIKEIQEQIEYSRSLNDKDFSLFLEESLKDLIFLKRTGIRAEGEKRKKFIKLYGIHDNGPSNGEITWNILKSVQYQIKFSKNELILKEFSIIEKLEIFFPAIFGILYIFLGISIAYILNKQAKSMLQQTFSVLIFLMFFGYGLFCLSSMWRWNNHKKLKNELLKLKRSSGQ